MHSSENTFNINSENKMGEKMTNREEKKVSVFKNKILYTEGIKWYSYLIPQQHDETRKYKPISLMEDYKTEDIFSSFLVALDTTDDSDQNRIDAIEKVGLFKKFALFKDYVEFYHYSLKFDAGVRSFYEVILGDMPQKPHFDVDIKREEYMRMYPDCNDFENDVQGVIETLIESCCLVLERHGIKIELDKHVLLFSSHGKDKRSYYLIIDGSIMRII